MATKPPPGQRAISRDEAPRPEQAARVPTKGRGTVWAIEHRYARQSGESYDDGWGTLDQVAEEERLGPGTQIIEERVKSILSKNDSPDLSFDLAINPYRGCEHAAITSISERVMPSFRSIGWYASVAAPMLIGEHRYERAASASRSRSAALTLAMIFVSKSTPGDMPR